LGNNFPGKLSTKVAQFSIDNSTRGDIAAHQPNLAW